MKQDAFCFCGCGKTVTTKSKWITGHWMKGRLSVRKGTKMTEEQRNKLRVPKNKSEKKDLSGNPCKCGCNQSAESRSGWVSGHWNIGKERDVKRIYNRITEEVRKKMSDSHKKLWEGKKKEIFLKCCSCGCGEMVKGKWVRGHHSRIENISKREDIKEIRRQQLNHLHSEGKMGDVWNRGLTAETDERVANNVKNLVSYVRSDEAKIKSSEVMKNNWSSGIILRFRALLILDGKVVLQTLLNVVVEIKSFMKNGRDQFLKRMALNVQNVLKSLHLILD